MSDYLKHLIANPRNNTQSRGMAFITDSDKRGTAAYAAQQKREYHAHGGAVGDMMREQAGMGANRPVSQHLLKAMAERERDIEQEYQHHAKGGYLFGSRLHKLEMLRRLNRTISKGKKKFNRDLSVEKERETPQPQRKIVEKKRLEARKEQLKQEKIKRNEALDNLSKLQKKTHLDDFTYDKYLEQLGGDCAANAAYRCHDYLTSTNKVPNLKKNISTKDEKEMKKKERWKVYKNRLETLQPLIKGVNNKDQTHNEHKSLAKFVKRANNADKYDSTPPVDQAGGVETDDYLRDSNYKIKDADPSSNPKDHIKGQVDYLHDTLKKKIPVIADGDVSYGGGKPGPHNFLITGIKNSNPQYRELKDKLKDERLHQIMNKPYNRKPLEPFLNKENSLNISEKELSILREKLNKYNQEELIDKRKKYNSTKDYPYKIYFSDSNRLGKQKGYMDKEGNIHSLSKIGANFSINHFKDEPVLLSNVSGYIDNNDEEHEI